MSETDRPIRYYLFPDDKDFMIVAMTDMEALQLWNQGKRWVDMPQETQTAAEQLRLKYRAGS